MLMDSIKKVFPVAILLSVAMCANAQNITENCYRGFVDVGYSLGVGDYKFVRTEVNTSHGFQFDPYLFCGFGMGLHLMPEYETEGMIIPLDTRDRKVDVTIFANLRYNITKGQIAPYVDLKGGTFVNNNGGLYLYGALGCRIAINEKQAMNFSVGYSSENLEFETFSGLTYVSGTPLVDRTRTKYDTQSITIKAGFEF